MGAVVEKADQPDRVTYYVAGDGKAAVAVIHIFKEDNQLHMEYIVPWDYTGRATWQEYVADAERGTTVIPHK